MDKKQATLLGVEEWWNNLPPVAQNGGLPAKGALAGALVVLERLQDEYVLELDHHRSARGQSQIAGAGGAATQRILARFGEHRPFLSEGGRTNRGLAGAISALFVVLRTAALEDLDSSERNQILSAIQEFLVTMVSEYFNQERIKFVFHPAQTTWQAVHDILRQARTAGKEGPVAQYLIGAKLALRFPDLHIRNDSYSTADVQYGASGDFHINDSVFHVTVAPMPGHYEKCQANIASGYRAHLIVPDRAVVGARQNAEIIAPASIAVHAIEAFVAQNIEELAVFSQGQIVTGFRRLLETYNERVDQVERDKSLLIDIPRNLI